MEEKKINRRSEKAGIFNFAKEMTSALVMAFIAIVYVIQAFKIPTGSMENSLLVGDFLLGLKFIYGAPVIPFTYLKFPGITTPQPGDVVIFKYPGTDRKDYIKRCVAGPGQTIEIEGTRVLVDNKEIVLPPRGIYSADGNRDPLISSFKKLRIPAKGDTIIPSKLEVREFLFLKHLVRQENPRKKVSVKYQLYINGEYANHHQFPTHLQYGQKISFDQIKFNVIDRWTDLDIIIKDAKANNPDKETEVRMLLYLNDKLIESYIVKHDNYFMMGDNRDNSLDSRYWGCVNKKFVKAKAFITYFSLNNQPYYLLPLKIRWNRIGKLIRRWDGLEDVKKTKN